MSAERDKMDDFLALAGRGFDREDDVVAGDEERVARIERAVQKRYGVRRLTRPRRLVAGVAGGFFVAGMAFAAWRESGDQDGTRPASSAVPARSAATLPLAAPSAVPSVVATAAGAPTASAARPLSSAAPRAAARASAQPLPEPTVAVDVGATAATLFAAANGARVAGDTARAVVLSQQLLARFPRSAEAGSTHLSLGMLWLQQGQAAQALAQFQAYEGQGTGEAMAEALWGKAQALQALARSDEERAILSELVRKFPRSAYVAAAQKRLAALP